MGLTMFNNMPRANRQEARVGPLPLTATQGRVFGRWRLAKCGVNV